VEDAEIIDCVAEAVGAAKCAHEAARVIPLSGKQGLLVCRVVLANGKSFVFKAVKEAGQREVSVAALLSEKAPGIAPRVYKAEQDAKRGLYWLVCEDVGPRRLADSPSIEGYVAAGRALARLQIASLDFLPCLAPAGASAVDTARWEEIGLGTLETAESRRQEVDVDSPALEEVVWSVSLLATDACACPPALVHGDLHAGNVAICSEWCDETTTVRLLDWGSAYVGAAFLGLEELLWPATRHLRLTDQRGRVRAAYLREWAPLLGKPGPLERAIAACSTLVRLELLNEALRRPHQFDVFAPAMIQRRLSEAFEAWQRA
jgi:hypothetical protein